MYSLKLFESYNLGFFFSKNYLEEIFDFLIEWKYLSKIIYTSEIPYNPSQYRSKFNNLDIELSEEEMNSWVVDYDFEINLVPYLENQIINEIEKKCNEYNLTYFVDRMPSGRYILTIMQFFPKAIQDFCNKIVKFGESGLSMDYKNVKFFLRLKLSEDHIIILQVFFIGKTPKENHDILIFSKFLERQFSRILGYQFEIEYESTSKDKKLGNYLSFNIPY